MSLAETIAKICDERVTFFVITGHTSGGEKNYWVNVKQKMNTGDTLISIANLVINTM